VQHMGGLLLVSCFSPLKTEKKWLYKCKTNKRYTFGCSS
jgi:hypothetical protein